MTTIRNLWRPRLGLDWGTINARLHILVFHAYRGNAVKSQPSLCQSNSLRVCQSVQSCQYRYPHLSPWQTREAVGQGRLNPPVQVSILLHINSMYIRSNATTKNLKKEKPTKENPAILLITLEPSVIPSLNNARPGKACIGTTLTSPRCLAAQLPSCPGGSWAVLVVAKFQCRRLLGALTRYCI